MSVMSKIRGGMYFVTHCKHLLYWTHTTYAVIIPSKVMAQGEKDPNGTQLHISSIISNTCSSKKMSVTSKIRGGM